MRRPVRSEIASRAETRRVTYLAIEGPPGIGKTALARTLARELGGRLVADPVHENPFLAPFHRDPGRFAFKAQLFLTLSRYVQLQDIAQQDLFQRLVVSDYLFVKDRIYAALALDDRELALYERLSGLMEPELPRPDLVVYLQADVGTLVERLHPAPDRAYLAAVVDAYNYYFLHYETTPLLVVNTGQTDPSSDPATLADLLRELERPHAGTRYLNPLAPS